MLAFTNLPSGRFEISPKSRKIEIKTVFDCVQVCLPPLIQDKCCLKKPVTSVHPVAPEYNRTDIANHFHLLYAGTHNSTEELLNCCHFCVFVEVNKTTDPNISSARQP